MKKDKCPNCGDNQKLTLIKNVGYDIHEGGEEHQHIQKCQCKNWRFVTDYFPFDLNKSDKHYGPWQKGDVKDD